MSTVYVTPNHDTSMVNSETETIDEGYNGWANYETWNVALWLGNDEGLYNWAREWRHHGYKSFSHQLMEFTPGTPDGVAWDDPELHIDELNEMMAEL